MVCNRTAVISFRASVISQANQIYKTSCKIWSGEVIWLTSICCKYWNFNLALHFVFSSFALSNKSTRLNDRWILHHKKIVIMIRITKRFLFLLLFCCCGKILFAQSKKIDSLLSVLKTAKDDTSKVNTLNAFAEGTSQARSKGLI